MRQKPPKRRMLKSIRKKKNPFKFEKVKGVISVLTPDKTQRYLKEISTVYKLGQFAYHDFFSNYTVYHFNSGMSIVICDTEKEAKIIIKRLYTKIKTQWEPKPRELSNFLNFHHEVGTLLLKNPGCGFSYKQYLEEHENELTDKDLNF